MYRIKDYEDTVYYITFFLICILKNNIFEKIVKCHD